jgi:hypothetical protein
MSLMDAASLIVVSVSEAEGVLWEIDQLLERGHCEKSLFVVPPTQDENRVLVLHLLVKLLHVNDKAQRNRLAAALESKVGVGWVAGVIFRSGTAKLFVSNRSVSQVQYDVTLRLAALD